MRFSISIIFFICSSCLAEQQQSQTQPIHIINPAAPSNITVSFSNANNNNNNNSSSSQHAQENNIGDLWQKFKDQTYEPSLQKLISLKEFTVAYSKEHAYFLIGCGVLLTYVLFFGQLCALHYRLTVNCHWSRWKQEYTIDQLRSLDQKELAKQLLTNIQEQYHKPTLLTDFLTPIISFFNDIEYELKSLNSFNRLHRWFDRLLLSVLFPTHHDLRKQSSDRIKRLDYLKQLLITWIAEYKIALNT